MKSGHRVQLCRSLDAAMVCAMLGALSLPASFPPTVPLQAYGANFNFSIWFVQLQGVADPPVVARARALFEEVCAVRYPAVSAFLKANRRPGRRYSRVQDERVAIHLSSRQQPGHLYTTVLKHLQHLEREAVRLCLKHFRQRNQLDVFEALQARTKMPLEDPMLTDLHDKLVRISGGQCDVQCIRVL
jgi:hypothetical protein